MSAQSVRITRTSTYWLLVLSGAIGIWIFCVFCGSIEFALYWVKQQFTEKDLWSASIVLSASIIGIIAILAAIGYVYHLVFALTDKVYEREFGRAEKQVREDPVCGNTFVLKFLLVVAPWPFLGTHLWSKVVETTVPDGMLFVALLMNSGTAAVMILCIGIGSWLAETIFPELGKAR